MKRYFTMKLLSAGLILVAWFTFAIMNLTQSAEGLWNKIEATGHSVTEFTLFPDTFDAFANEDVFSKMNLIETYGFLQKLMLKNEQNNFEVIRDTDGKLHYANFADGPNDVKEIVNAVSALNRALFSTGSKLTVLMPPDKVLQGVTTFDEALPYSYHNETADRFLEAMLLRGIKAIDFRDSILDSGIPSQDIFFDTDHHWTIESNFWAFTHIVEQFNEIYDLDLDPEGFYTDPENYNFITYEKSYLGSMGRKTGVIYAGADDFTVIFPKFETKYRFDAFNPLYEVHSEGRFEDALIIGYPFNIQNYEQSINTDKYFAYLQGNQSIVTIKNEFSDGPRVLIIKDSMSVPMTAFLSTVCSEVVLIDPRFYEENIIEYAVEGGFDHVLVSIYPQNLTPEFFDYNTK
jgi:hypothetical protein